MQTSTSVLPALTAVTSMHCAAILWEPTHARVKQVIQAMEEHALVSCLGVVKISSRTVSEDLSACICYI